MANLILSLLGILLIGVGLWLYNPGLSLTVVGAILLIGVVGESVMKVVSGKR